MNQQPDNLNEMLHAYAQDDEEELNDGFPSDDDYFLDQDYRNWAASLDTDYLKDILDIPVDELMKTP